jgi:diguanylate cyclase (GGDEF)-like protein
MGVRHAMPCPLTFNVEDLTLPELAAVPMVVLARTQDFAAVINSTLRNAGLAAHCTWIQETKDLADALSKGNIEMLIAFVGADPGESHSIMKIRNQTSATVPVIFVRERIDEEIIAVAMQMGARDVVTLGSRGRLQAVVAREVNAARIERELARAKTSASSTQQQVKAIMAGTADAIGFVQDGIVVDANPAWLKAFGIKQNDAIIGHPLMDFLDTSAHAAFKAAVSACVQGKWKGELLRAAVRMPDKSSQPLEFQLARGEYDGDPAVRVSIIAKKEEIAVAPPPEPKPAPAPTPAPEPVTVTVTQDSGRDLTTGLWQRRAFTDRMQSNLARPPKAGIRQLIAIEPDKLPAIAEQLGPIVIEDFLAQMVAVLGEHFKTNDLLGRFGDGIIMALVERGTTRDVDALVQSVMAKMAAHVFHIDGKSVMCTCSVGSCLVDMRAKDPAAALSDALQGLREAQAQGGNRVQFVDRSDADTKQQANDAIWVRLIKSALMDNRFKLMQQPIASLLGAERGMFDVLVRLIDEQGNDILPAEFMAAAERNDLMKNIDRWVISNSMLFCGSRQVERLFVRVSRDSVRDKSLPQWLNLQLKSTRIDPSRIAFQVSEPVAAEYLADTNTLATAVRQAGFKFALEHFGSGIDSSRLLRHLTVDYLKIDGALMQSLAVDTDLQARVKELVDAARNRKISTIAERVEDANTMAILWQLGIEYIQGYFVNEPEQVVMGS